MAKLDAIRRALPQGITEDLWGLCPFAAVREKLLPCRALHRLPPEAKTVLCVLFPYRAEVGAHNLSRYAIGPDYHQVVTPLLQQTARALGEQFPSNRFEAFVDNSPIPEVLAAALCGLGAVGDNGLLIHPAYGSWVFIGEIVTDLALGAEVQTVRECLHCGACRRLCPGGALGHNGLRRERCVSHLTQKKGALTLEEQAAVRAGGLVWGCDRCQEVCPMNRAVKKRGLPCFQQELYPIIGPGEGETLPRRAFHWRPAAVLARNFCIFDREDGNPMEE